MTVYREIFEKLPDGIAIHEVEDGSIVDANDRFCELLGYSRSEILDLEFDALHVDEELSTSERAEQYIRMAATEGPRTFERRDVTKSGDPLPVEVHLRHTSIDGEERILAVVRDISERKPPEQELRARATAMENAIDGMAILDADGTYTFVNQAHADIYGYDGHDTFLGEHWTLCYGVDERARFETEILPTLQEEGFWRGEALGQRQDGTTFPQELSLTTLDDGGMVCVVRDIAERKAYERELERQNERLDSFAEIVSHDLRNPLGVATGHLEGVRAETDNEALDEIAWALDRMDELVTDVLALAREGRQLDESEPVALATLTEQCWAAVSATDAELRVVTDRRVVADRSRLKRLLENLFRNALDHGGAHVTITVGDTDQGFYVADDGLGIPDDERDVVFEHGHSGASDGTGFGLSIVAEIARAHDWEVGVTESETGGARFEFTGVTVLES